MIFGCEPWISPQKGDPFFDLIMDGKLINLLKAWNKHTIVNKALLRLFDGFFRCQYDRITIEDIQNSEWFKHAE